MSKPNYALRLLPSLKDAASELAASEGTSLNQWINVAVAEKVASLRTATYFRDRAAQADIADFWDVLDKAPDLPPTLGDEPNLP